MFLNCVHRLVFKKAPPPPPRQTFGKLNLFAFSSEELVESHTECGLTEYTRGREH